MAGLSAVGALSTVMGEAVVLRRVAIALKAYLFALVFLQKFSLGVIEVSVMLPATYLMMAALAATGALKVRPTLVALYLGFVVLAAASQTLVDHPYSIASMMLVVVLYLPLAFTLRLPLAVIENVVAFFQRLMLLVAGIVVVQWTWGHVYHGSINLEHLLPVPFYLPGYNYDATAWGASVARPTGVFFLETSFASMFLAVALINELRFFRRPFQVIAFSAGLVLCQGATGFFMLAIAAPILALRLRSTWVWMAIAVAACAAIALYSMGFLDPIFTRLGEFHEQGTSGFLRIVAPFQQLLDAINRIGSPLDIYGAGNAPISGSSAWPVTKLYYEYGPFVALLLVAMMSLAARPSGPNAALLLSLLVTYNFTGGYLQSPVLVPLLLVFGSLLRERPVRRPESV